MRASLGIFVWTLALSLFFGVTNDALSEVYRWKDSKGVIHFSDQPISTDPQVAKEVRVPRPNLANAFKASQACFAACAKPNGASGTNTAGCGHCAEQPMPQCWSRN